MSEETLLERATRNNFGRDPYQIAPNALGHRVRLSDASSFDEVCVCCGGTDRIGSSTLDRPCQAALPSQTADMGRLDADAIIAYDLERAQPAPTHVHDAIRAIADKPHHAPQIIAALLRDRS